MEICISIANLSTNVQSYTEKESNLIVEVVAILVIPLIIIADRRNLNEERYVLTHDFRSISINYAEVVHHFHL